MAIRRVTGAVSPSELIFADANALGATYDGSGTTIERGETFTLPAGGTTAVSNGALRLEALKGDCTITNNGNSTLTNASGVDGTIVMRSGASDFPAFVRNSSLGSMSTPAREDFTGDVSGTINSNATFPAGVVIQAVYWRIPATSVSTAGSWAAVTDPTGNNTYGVANTSITRKSTNSKMIGVATGHVDHNTATSTPAVVSLTPAGGGTAGNTIFGAGYRHVRNSQTEPFVYSFAFEDDFSAQPNPAVPTYYLRCHSSTTHMYFSRVYPGNYTSNPFTLLFWEVEI